ncbi:helix-turn-helix domain-containing protein [Ruegeria lacuscaerulensis]|uniref:helix-turn-helix domain-containing protein n=1 Tax=Ruegeria lacuscaerulensis TaxID=55218 RepID=UPI00147BC759|nr:helix-turn-helix transcriptional regulator [Ruegeria lacuscaerulensis]
MTKTLHSEGQLALVAALIKARKDAGLSQMELANKLRCHQSFVARVESGQRRVDVPELVILCRALSVNPIEILNAVVCNTPKDARI